MIEKFRRTKFDEKEATAARVHRVVRVHGGRKIMDDDLDKIREQTTLELRIDKIWQKLFWYDNVPTEEDIVSYVMEWREIRKRLKELGVDNAYTR